MRKIMTDTRTQMTDFGAGDQGHLARQLTINQLRVRGGGADPLATQLRLANLLEGMRLHPAGLPAVAILCIRELADPLPGALDLARPGVRPPPAWEQAITTALDQVARRAARPGLGAVPANAAAVLFADQAELLACLSSDWCAGRALHHWWWASLFRHAPLSQVVYSAWLERVAYAPAALQRLADSRQVIPLVRALDAATNRALLQQIARRFALPELHTALLAILVDAPGETSAPEIPSETHSPAPEATPPRLPQAQAAPWVRWVPESAAPGLSLLQASLLGVGLMLQRAPAQVRSADFVQAVIDWQRPAPLMDREGGATAASPAQGSGETVPAQEAGPPPATEAISRPVTKPPPPAAAPQPPPEDAGASQHLPPATPIGAAESIPSPPAASSVDQAWPAAAAATGPYLAESVETGYGGIFYLLNLALYLELYGDFSTPAAPGLPLPIWDFVALLGRRLVGSALQSDPVWPLLARLAGRAEGDAPGQDFDPPGAWRMPVEWLRPFAAGGPWIWSAVGGWLRVWHPAGFWVLDVPREEGQAREQLVREMEGYGEQQLTIKFGNPVGAVFNRTVVLRRAKRAVANRTYKSHLSPRHYRNNNYTFTMRGGLARWVGWLAPYFEARLCRALGLADGARLAQLLCRHPARLTLTGTHLDIMLSLEELPIEIRLAGLDRDPGWIPAAGRFVAFHFT